LGDGRQNVSGFKRPK